MDPSEITFAVLGGAVVAFVTNKVPVALVALAVPLALWAIDVLEIDEAFAGFGDPTVIFIASLFVLADALDDSGVTAWIGQQLVSRVGDGGGPRVVGLVMLVSAVITAF